jgi:GntR family transcriptional regulator / MocR family aminotransferase
MELTVSFSEDEPFYRQLYIHIRTLIQNGVIKDGTKLPSIRSLMQQLQISKTTVETAYHMLLEEGYVRSKERSGLIVINPAVTKPPAPSSTLDPISNQTFRALTGSHEKNFIDFNLLALDGELFPIRTWKSVVSEAISLHNQYIHHYGDPRGEYGLRESLTEYLQRSRGVVCSPEQILIGTGLSYSIQLLFRLLGDHNVGIEKSGIAQVRKIFIQNKFHLIPISMNETEPLEQELERSRIRNLYVTPSHRPSGDPLSYSLRQQMLQWAQQNKGYLIEDDYDGELRLYGKPIPSLQSLDQNGVVIYIGTFSKVFTPALRMNYMILPLPLMEKLLTFDHLLSPPSRIDQWAMQLFISRGHWYRHLKRIRKSYRLKQQALVQILNKYMPSHVQVEGSKTGLHIELSIKSSLGTEQFIQLARNHGVLIYGSQDTELQSTHGISKVYLGFGGISEKEMERGVRLLKRAWSSEIIT